MAVMQVLLVLFALLRQTSPHLMVPFLPCSLTEKGWHSSPPDSISLPSSFLVSCHCSYLAICRASVLISCGRDEPAGLQHAVLKEQAARLPEGHPAEALMHSVCGHLLLHQGQLQRAFEHLVQVCTWHVGQMSHVISHCCKAWVQAWGIDSCHLLHMVYQSWW